MVTKQGINKEIILSSVESYREYVRHPEENTTNVCVLTLPRTGYYFKESANQYGSTFS